MLSATTDLETSEINFQLMARQYGISEGEKCHPEEIDALVDLIAFQITKDPEKLEKAAQKRGLAAFVEKNKQNEAMINFGELRMRMHRLFADKEPDSSIPLKDPFSRKTHPYLFTVL